MDETLFMDESYRRISALLDRKGVSLAAFARDMGVKRQTVNHWRITRVPPDKYADIAQHLGKSIEWVAGLVPEDDAGTPPLSPMARRLAEEFDRIEAEAQQLAAFVQCLEAIRVQRDIAAARPRGGPFR